MYNPFKTYSLDDDDEDLQKAAKESSSAPATAPSSFDSARASNQPSAPPSGPIDLPSTDATTSAFKKPNPAVGLASASMEDQPSAGRVNDLRAKLEQETAPMSPGRKALLSLASLVPVVGPTFLGITRDLQNRQIAGTEHELQGAEAQRNTEYSHDAALRQAMIQEADASQRSVNDINARQRTATATTYDPTTALPSTFQFNPGSGRFDIPMGPGKPPGPEFQIQRHPQTNQPVAIQRRNGQVIYDQSQMTPAEKMAFATDAAAYTQGIQTQQDLIDQRDQDALKRTIAGATAAALAATNRGITVNQGNQTNADYGDAMAASTRARVMHQLLPKAQAGDAQADLAILANHLGMTMGQIKGARMNQALIREAAQAKGYGNGDREIGWFQHIMSGSILAPEQRQQMIDLADEMEQSSWDKADNAAKLYGLPMPKGRSQVGPGTTQNPITQGAGSGNTQQNGPTDPLIGKTMYSKSRKHNVTVTGKNPDGTYIIQDAP